MRLRSRALNKAATSYTGDPSWYAHSQRVPHSLSILHLIPLFWFFWIPISSDVGISQIKRHRGYSSSSGSSSGSWPLSFFFVRWFRHAAAQRRVLLMRNMSLRKSSVVESPRNRRDRLWPRIKLWSLRRRWECPDYVRGRMESKLLRSWTLACWVS